MRVRVMELAVVSDTPEVLHVAVRGAITMNNRSEPLGEQLGTPVYARRVLFNLAEASYIDSGGVSWLIICHKRLLTNGGRLVLHGVPDLIRKVLDLLNLKAVLALAPDEAAGRAKLLA